MQLNPKSASFAATFWKLKISFCFAVKEFFVLDLLELHDPIASLLSKRSISTSPFAMRLRSSSAFSGVQS